MKGLERVARAVRSVFKQQRMQAEDLDKSRFGDWNSKLAQALSTAVAELYLDSAKRAGADPDLHVDDFVALAKARAIETARLINATTSEWLQEGRDYEEVFGGNRVMMVASTEAVNALGAGRVVVAATSKKRLRWVCKGDACPECRALNGKVVRAGKPFTIIDGKPIYNPPAHPNCYCELEDA